MFEEYLDCCGNNDEGATKPPSLSPSVTVRSNFTAMWEYICSNYVFMYICTNTITITKWPDDGNRLERSRSKWLTFVELERSTVSLKIYTRTQRLPNLVFTRMFFIFVRNFGVSSGSGVLITS